MDAPEANKVGFIGRELNGKGQTGGADLGQPLTDTLVGVMDAEQWQAAELRRIACSQVQSEQAQKLAEFGGADLEAPGVAVLPTILRSRHVANTYLLLQPLKRRRAIGSSQYTYRRHAHAHGQ